MGRKTGLHKKISSIFSGVPIPKAGSAPSSAEEGLKREPAPAYKPEPKPAYRHEPSVPEYMTREAFHEPPAVQKKEAVVEVVSRSEDYSKLRQDFGLWISKVKVSLYGNTEGLSKRNLYMSIFVVFLGIVFIMIVTTMYGGKKGATIVKTNVKAGTASIVSLAEFDKIWNWPEPYSSEGRDPTKPGSTVYAGEIFVSGILYGEKPMAVINNQILGISDVVSGCKIIDITRDYVEFDDKNGEKFRLSPGQKKK